MTWPSSSLTLSLHHCACSPQWRCRCCLLLQRCTRTPAGCSRACRAWSPGLGCPVADKRCVLSLAQVLTRFRRCPLGHISRQFLPCFLTFALGLPVLQASTATVALHATAYSAAAAACRPPFASSKPALAMLTDSHCRSFLHSGDVPVALQQPEELLGRRNETVSNDDARLQLLNKPEPCNYWSSLGCRGLTRSSAHQG